MKILSLCFLLFSIVSIVSGDTFDGEYEQKILHEKLHTLGMQLKSFDKDYQLFDKESESQNIFGVKNSESSLNQSFTEYLDGRKINYSKFKIVRVTPNDSGLSTQAWVSLQGLDEKKFRFEYNALWKILWKYKGDVLTITHIEELESQEASAQKRLYVDKTGSLFVKSLEAWTQLRTPGPEWLKRLTNEVCYTQNFLQGITVVDINDDELDDVYICQNDGFPNRLLIQQADGTLKDISRESGLDFLDRTRTAIFADLDNDGDKDALLATRTRLLVMENLGAGQFNKKAELMNEFPSLSSIAVADYDQDSLLDFYVCSYYKNENAERFSARPSPENYQDAHNGAENKLFKNLGSLSFQDVTADVGLDQNNCFFSLSATWHDFDSDGDLDLYVANDFGRNNLYVYDEGSFEDNIDDYRLQDRNFSMNAVWGDWNRDGKSDLYVSNMFSSAGNRVTFQSEFLKDNPSLKKQLQHLARGNSLFTADSQGKYEETALVQKVALGRWAWGAHFADVDNNGWQDLLVANGYLTGRKPDDL